VEQSRCGNSRQDEDATHVDAQALPGDSGLIKLQGFRSDSASVGASPGVSMVFGTEWDDVWANVALPRSGIRQKGKWRRRLRRLTL